METIYNINELERMRDAVRKALEMTAILSHEQVRANPTFNWHDLYDAYELLMQLIKEEESK